MLHKYLLIIYYIDNELGEKKLLLSNYVYNWLLDKSELLKTGSDQVYIFESSTYGQIGDLFSLPEYQLATYADCLYEEPLSILAENEKGRNASDDIKNEIIKLKAQNIEGIVLDLRNNGGGSLTEVGDIMGLFMNAGPYVQVKDGNGKIQTLKNKNETPVWTGPLVIMQNELSASASEILAGVMQDYGRAMIIGSPQSFGKGTVQTFVDLNRFLNTEDDFGSLKLTIQKFYRITGESTQRKGVSSDIKMKDIFSYADIGEKYDDYALAWDKIPGTSFNKQNFLNIQALQKVSAERIAKNENYKLLLEYAQWRENLGKEKTMPLSMQKYSDLMKQRKAQDDKFKVLKTLESGLQFTMYSKDIER